MHNAINSFGVGRIAHMILMQDRPVDRLAALARLRANLGPYDADGTLLEAAIDDYFDTDPDRIRD